MMDTTVVGSLPFKPGGKKLMSTYYAQGDPFQETIKSSVECQLDAGIQIVSDGQTRADMIKLYASRIDGIRIRGKPIVLKELSFRGPITRDDQAATRKILDETGRPDVKIKGIVTGPQTMAVASVNEHYKNKEELAYAYAEVMNKEALSVEPVVDMIQFDEPFFSQEFPEYSKELIEIARKGLTKPVGLHACGDVQEIFEQLVEFPVDILDHEFYSQPHLVDHCAQFDISQRVGFGSVNSASEVVETVNQIAEHIRKGAKLFGPKRLFIDPDCGLGNLKLPVAVEKLNNLVKARDLVLEEL